MGELQRKKSDSKQMENSNGKIPMGKLQWETSKGKLWGNSRGKAPKGKVQWTIPMEEVHREMS